MAEHGSEKRQRNVTRTVRLTRMEDAMLLTYADLAGLTAASYMRMSALKMPPPRAARRPTLDQALAARLLGQLGDAAAAFRQAAALADPQAAETAMNDLSEYRLMVFEAMGRKP